MTISLSSWFAASVERYPGEPALEVDGQSLTYSELGGLVDSLAAHLLAAGTAPPRRVALLASRTVAAYAGYLAALRLGTTVIPLNPTAPGSRTSEICRLAEPDLLLVDRHGARQRAELDFGGRRIGVVELAEPAWAARLPDRFGRDLPGLADPEHPAYLLFTSGSTGRPKGVPIRHDNLAAFLEFNIERYEAGPGCRLSQTFDLTFDPSVFDMFVAWGSGATLVVPSRSELLLPARFVSRRGITHWYSVPSIVSLAMDFDELPADSMPGLRYSLFAGEQLTLGQAAAWRRAARGSRIENLYGPTELAITCTRYRLPDDDRLWPATSNGTVPIGEVYPHLDAVLLADGRLDPVEGELCVRGPQRFDGYLDAADDRGRFLSVHGDTVSDEEVELVDHGHWYRTGDRVRMEHGALVHLGRADDQIKIRGIRIEPGEIEAALRARDGVRDAVVTVRQSPDGDAELVAFYTGAPLHADHLAADLAAALPPYLVPRRYVHMADFPMTDTGKVDRKRFTDLLDHVSQPQVDR